VELAASLPEPGKLVEDGFGYESVIGNWNLSDAIPWFIDDFGPGQSYEAVERGFGYLIECLQKHLDTEGPRFTCHVFFNTRVRKVTVTADEPFRYNIQATKTAKRYKHKNDTDAWDSHEDDEMHWREWNAGSVILAIPKEPLSKLDVTNLLGDPGADCEPEAKKNFKPIERNWHAKLDTVRSHRLAKLVHAYRAPWWQTPESPKGAGALIITDLPLRQLYYWDQEWLDKRGRYEFYDDNGKRIVGESGRYPDIGGIVVAYLDGHYVSYWRFITSVQRRSEAVATFRDDENDSIPGAEEAEREKRKRFGDRIWAWSDPQEVSPMKWSVGEEDRKAPRIAELYGREIEEWSDEERTRYLYLRKHGLFERASTKMTNILKDLHASMKSGTQVSVDEPVVGTYTFWDDFGDDPIPETGWHTWEPGVNSEEAMNYMAQPFERDKAPLIKDKTPLRVYVCGEAYSNEQGWIEGALKSVERVIEKLGVKLPSDVCEHAGVCRKEHKHDVDGAKEDHL
jgi:hypothetical protein